ncbi:AAA family ATPase [Kitasatospora sp. NPDC057223]|uniref:ATP-binding protein n=1 Tax=Kitasatospora sp. NPDC057223 TaxID=3346055 RepID=UPI003625E0F2
MARAAGPAVEPTLRGRAGELEAVLGELRRVARGGGSQLVVVDGEPGMGKTAFLRAVREQAERGGFAVGAAPAGEGDRTTPLATLGLALRAGGRVPLLDAESFGALLPLVGQPLWLAERLAALLKDAAAARPLLVVLDDVHWADPLSVFVLRILPARLADSRVVLLLCGRPVPGGPADQVGSAAEEGGAPVLRLVLGPLTEEAVLEVARDRLGGPADRQLAMRLSEARGVPFLAVQIVAGLVEAGGAGPDGGGLPPGLLAGVRRRLAPASELCRSLLRAGAVLGPSFALADAAHLLSEPAVRLLAPLEEALAAGLLTDDGQQVRFRHDLLRRAVYEDVPPSVRQHLHRSAAERLLSDGGAAAPAAPHVLACARPGDTEAVEVLRRAAFELLDTMAVTSAGLIRQAYDLAGDDAGLRDTLGRDVVDVLIQARQFGTAEDFAATLLAQAAPETEAGVRLLLAPQLWADGRRADLAALARDVPSAPSALRRRLAAYRVWANEGPQEGPQEPFGEAPGETRPDSAAPDPVAAAVAAAVRAQRAEAAGRYAEALAGYRRALELGAGRSREAGALPAAPLLVRTLVMRAVLGEVDEVLAETETAGGVPGLDSWAAARLAAGRAQVLLGAGRLAQAAESASRALRLAGEIGDPSVAPEARHVLGRIALLQDRRSDARAELAAAGGRAALPVLAALLADAEGRPDAAARLVRAAADTPLPWREEFLVEAACSAHHAGDRATLEEAVRQVDVLADRNPGAGCLSGAAALARGLASADFDAAQRALAVSSRPLLRARASEEAGRAALATDRAGALTLLEDALNRYEEAGAVAPAARVWRRLHTAGVRRRGRRAATRPATGWESLTATERKVAWLVAQGHTNRSAAARLVVAPSTVGTHLRSVFGKLGVTSRVQLTLQVVGMDGPAAGVDSSTTGADAGATGADGATTA